jgi:ribose transport system ATP-binding protein
MTTDTTPRLLMRSISKQFGATAALSNVSLSVPPGEIHALVGENGAGKSTLMKVLSGAIRPDTGELELDGRPFSPAGPLTARRNGVAMIYQELSLAPHLSVQDNIVLGVEPVGRVFIDRSTAASRARVALERLDHPEIPLDANVAGLPIATRQLVEIARALAADARVIVFDEPTSSLAGDDVSRLFDIIRKLRDDGLAIVYISHFLEEVQALVNRFTVLRDGRTVGSGRAADTSVEDMVEMMVGRRVADLYSAECRAPGEVLLEARGLAGRERPTRVDLTVRRGEVLGIAGLVGAGRTETMRVIFGLDPVRSGHLRFRTFTGPYSPARRLAQGMGMLSEDRTGEGLASRMDVTDNLTLSRLPVFFSPARRRAQGADWIRRLNIRCLGADQPVAHLSGGNQQKVALARLLRDDVDLLLLDEPTRGVDIASKSEIYRIVRKLAASGKALLLVSSHLPELLGIADRIAVMHRGKLGPAKPVEECTGPQLLLEATGHGGPR